MNNMIMGTKKNGRRYSKELQTPIRVPSKDGSNPWVNAVADAQLERKLRLLFQHYRINDQKQTRWRSLALHLANRHVAGMQIVFEPIKRKGAKKHWLPETDLELIGAFDHLLKKGNALKVASATLVKNDARWKGKNPVSLQNRYHEAKRRLISKIDQDSIDRPRVGLLA